MAEEETSKIVIEVNKKTGKVKMEVPNTVNPIQAIQLILKLAQNITGSLKLETIPASKIIKPDIKLVKPV